MIRTSLPTLAPFAACVLALASLASRAHSVHAEPPAADSPASEGAHDPDNEQFARLLEAEKRYRAIADAGGWPSLADGEPMKPGQSNDCARLDGLAKRLEIEGYRRKPEQAGSEPVPMPGAATQGSATVGEAAPPGRGQEASAGDVQASNHIGATPGCAYGPDLSTAVEGFQKDRYLTVDGIVGGQTQRQLAKPVEDVLSKIDYSLKRWRANAANLSGSYIVVNIPAFELGVYDGRREVLRMPVIVGMPSWPTPEMSDKIDSIVVNPSWNIPKSIADAEVIPKSKKDSGYFAREGIVTTDGGTLRQKPGPRNPLGRLKFMMPNREDIYLHDTPGKQKFGAPARAFSHGCVRVENPFQLAAHLLGDPTKDAAALEKEMQTGKTKTYRLREPVPVLVMTWSVVVSGDGRVDFLTDLYGQDDEVLAGLDGTPVPAGNGKVAKPAV